ncbi:hypothetical protein GCM10022631_40780 [Deinococcus rubellus]|uniref:Uncharacterized protein n=1 Tax=Deinococcus rubellus TaxID=1889240 RepID=A0ABY5YID3_9DEIO|nr:hypothetical protein [Deinococcus rubellus]UWX63867.1 hypothetical protein N0D28_14245 [Deinococcus rubellus]
MSFALSSVRVSVWTVLLGALVVLAGLGLLFAWRTPVDQAQIRASAVIERCTVAFSANHFAAAVRELGGPVTQGSFKVLPETVQAAGGGRWTARIESNLFVGDQEHYPVFLCTVGPQGVALRTESR